MEQFLPVRLLGSNGIQYVPIVFSQEYPPFAYWGDIERHFLGTSLAFNPITLARDGTPVAFEADADGRR